jgi:prolipoprotein diacylglyceryltransferase
VLPLLHVPLASAGVHLVVSTYALALIAAGIVGSVVFARRCPAPVPVWPAAGALWVAALAGARWAALALHEMDGVGLAGRGLSSSGALVGGLLAAIALARACGTRAVDLLAALAPAGLVACGIGRVGCFLAGCCRGRPTDLPWGVVLPDLGPPARHPAQLYEAGGDLLLAAFAGAAGTSKAAVRRAAVGYALLRGGLEAVRDPVVSDRVLGGWLPLAPALAFLLAAAALCVSAWRRAS